MASENDKNTPRKSPLGNMGGNKGKKPRFNFYWIYGLMAVVLFATYFMDFGPQ